jgi:hypothetical protein
MSRFMAVYEPITEGFFSDILNKIGGVLKTIWKTIKTIVDKVFSTIGGYIKKLIIAIKKFINGNKSSMSANTIQISDDFKDDVKDKNVTHIRDTLTTIAHEDRAFKTGKFDAYLDYAKKANISDLFDSFDGEEFKPKTDWDKDYWSYVCASLMDNFCKERIDHLKDVGEYVYGGTATEASESSNDSQLCVPFSKIYGLLVEHEKGIDIVSSMTTKFYTSKALYTDRIKIDDTTLDMLNGNKNGEIDSAGNIKHMSAQDIVKFMYNASDSERGFKLELASELVRTLDVVKLQTTSNRFVLKHSALKAKIDAVFHIMSDKSNTMKDFASKKIDIMHDKQDAIKYKANFAYNMNVVKSISKSIIEELNALMHIFGNTYSAIMHEYLSGVKSV